MRNSIIPFTTASASKSPAARQKAHRKLMSAVWQKAFISWRFTAMAMWRHEKLLSDDTGRDAIHRVCQKRNLNCWRRDKSRLYIKTAIRIRMAVFYGFGHRFPCQKFHLPGKSFTSRNIPLIVKSKKLSTAIVDKLLPENSIFLLPIWSLFANLAPRNGKENPASFLFVKI